MQQGHISKVLCKTNESTTSWSVVLIYLICRCYIAAPSASAVASFSDARYTVGGVCPNDPLIFTCEVNCSASNSPY